MTPELRPPITLAHTLSPLLVAVVWIALFALLKEPTRRRFSAIVLAGAGAAYMGAGLGGWELAFMAAMTLIAYKGLESYRLIGVAWVLHAGWDVAHHLYGNPIIPFLPLSSFGCAVCDLGLAAWYVAGAPSPWPWVRHADTAATA